MTLNGKLLERRYGSISGESKEEQHNEENVDRIDRGRGTVDIQGSSSVFLQLVRLKRLSSMMKAFFFLGLSDHEDYYSRYLLQEEK